MKIDLPVSVGYKVAMNIKTLEPYALQYDVMRRGIISKYGTDGEVTPQDEHYDDCLKEISELEETDVDIKLETIPYEAIENLQLPMEVIYGLTEITERGKNDSNTEV